MEENTSVIPSETTNQTTPSETQATPIKGGPKAIKPSAEPKPLAQPKRAPKTTGKTTGDNATPKTEQVKNAQRTLTQEQVNKIIQRRILASQTNLYKKYGANDATEFEALISKANKYGDLETQYNQTLEKLQTYENKKFLFENGVSLSKYDDVVTYMKGKGLDLTPVNVQEVLKTHPEWIRQAKKPAVGPARVGNTGSISQPRVSDAEVIRGLFPSLTKK
jgi:hypothetical protein